MRCTWKYLDADMANGESYQSIAKGEKVSMPYEKLLSFLLTISLVISGTTAYIFAVQGHVLFVVITWVTIIWATFLGIFLVYYIFNYYQMEGEPLLIVYESMRQLFTKPSKTFFLLSIFIFSGIIFILSKFIFICLIPGINFELIRRVFSKSEEELEDNVR